ncbi:MAG TPA: alternative ribosome rescue aminoacyl-tRNA hydrolase ArfB [Gammaproteobacteria bacterium]|nr:alternative ribosome rescue aminoacyl-tRNA hydrolase ArfB [Gammaproteobacteria bacterium]
MPRRRLVIPEEALEFRFVRSAGPGGQNVNKVASAVQLRVDLARCGLADDVRARLARLAGRRVTAAGELVIVAQRFRTQERNRADALERLAALLHAALTPPRPRKATQPTAASKRRRIEAKTRRAGIKRLRGRVKGED